MAEQENNIDGIRSEKSPYSAIRDYVNKRQPKSQCGLNAAGYSRTGQRLKRDAPKSLPRIRNNILFAKQLTA
ncbi:hypothetical protein [Methylomonas sp. ZR1]|uniref:hypothetical protein n=1 Tax=Methylomonas sp. ZR1 TaxID=1797072 RepID=UPI0014924CE5|nr:hypothetical protein [Methylomonas sp. ZR1]